MSREKAKRADQVGHPLAFAGGEIESSSEDEEITNEKYLHYETYGVLEGLAQYHNLRSLQAGCKNIKKLEGLDYNYKLKHLNLHQNKIKVMENMHCLHSLVTLNLSNNHIKKIEGLTNLDHLKNLDLANNLIPDTDSC